MRKRTSKFYSKSLILAILRLIQNGLILKEIARALDISPSHLTYYVKKAEKEGYVKEVFRTAFKSYELAQAGKNLLDQYEKNSSSPPLLCRAENIQFRADIVQMPTVPVDWKNIQMHNWVQRKSQIDQVMVRINLGKNPSIEFLPSPVEGDDPFQIFVILVFEVVNVILKLFDTIGLRVGPLQLGSRGEWLVYDPVARIFCRMNGQVKYEGVAKVNASKPRSIGEIEFFDPRALLAYISMPSLVARTDKRAERIETMVEKLIENEEFKKTQIDIAIISVLTSLFFKSYFCWFPLFVL